MTESARQSAGATSIFSESDKSLLQQLVQTNKELVDSNKSLAKRVSELEEKAGTKERPKADEVVGLTNGQLFAKLNDAGLPSMLATQIADGYTAGSDVDAQIEQAKALTDEIAKGLAPTETTETTEPVAAEKVEESDRGIGYVSESAAPTETFGTVLTGFFNQAG